MLIQNRKSNETCFKMKAMTLNLRIMYDKYFNFRFNSFVCQKNGSESPVPSLGARRLNRGLKIGVWRGFIIRKRMRRKKEQRKIHNPSL